MLETIILYQSLDLTKSLFFIMVLLHYEYVFIHINMAFSTINPSLEIFMCANMSTIMSKIMNITVGFGEKNL